VASKGRPRTSRMKERLEKLSKGSSNRGYCNKSGHNQRTCRALNRAMYQMTILYHTLQFILIDPPLNNVNLNIYRTINFFF
jgi:ABC-type enterochelin transport system ATPase subunit